MQHAPKNGTFTSRLGFVLAAVGSAVGMGNIWLFPYRLGQYGGAAFLIPYLLFVALFGYVGLSGEFALGRLTGTGPIGSYEHALKSRGKRGGAILGTIPLLGSLGIAIGYAIIVGWVVRCAFGALTGTLLTAEPETFFAEMITPFGSVPWHVFVILIVAIILLGGVGKGIEKINKIMMPAFFVLFLILAVRVLFLPGSSQGYRYLLIPNWSYLLRIDTWIMAMGQAFFSLSITGSGMIIYGSYLHKKENIIHSSVMTAVLDTCAAMLAGFVIIPAVFAFGLDPQAGPPLLFLTLPRVFQQMPLGRLFALFFFLSVLFAGITSLTNMLEAVCEAAQSRIGLSRKTAVLAACAITLVVGLFIEYEPFLNTWMNIITIYIVPIGAVLGAIVIYWVLGLPTIKRELMQGRSTAISPAFGFLARYVYILLAALVVLCSLLIPGGIG